MTKTITLYWTGPTEPDHLNKKAPKAPGVYLWCVLRDNKYVVTYVGKSGELNGRLVQELKEIRGGSANLLQLESELGQMDDHDFESVYRPGYDLPTKEDLQPIIDRNAQKLRVFWAESKDSDPFTPVEVEGALQAHLIQKAETRKYMTTGVSTWRLTDTTLINEMVGGDMILGLESQIDVPG